MYLSDLIFSWDLCGLPIQLKDQSVTQLFYTGYLESKLVPQLYTVILRFSLWLLIGQQLKCLNWMRRTYLLSSISLHLVTRISEPSPTIFLSTFRLLVIGWAALISNSSSNSSSSSLRGNNSILLLQVHNSNSTSLQSSLAVPFWVLVCPATSEMWS